MHDFSLFPKRCKMRAPSMSFALEGSFAEHYHKHDCILKARASDLHSERHKTWPGQALAFGMYWLLKTKKKPQYKNRLRNKILKYHWLLFHSSGSPSPLSYMSSTSDVHRPWELHLPVQRQVTAYHWWYILLLVIALWGHTRKQTSFLSAGIWENLTAYCAIEPT